LTGLPVWRCESCGHRSFPRRELCPVCGSRSFTAEPADRGIVTELTSHRSVDVAYVRVDHELTVLARAEGAVAAGSEVTLRVDDGAPVATVA
jgi:uncharacterized OB-fold protein